MKTVRDNALGLIRVFVFPLILSIGTAFLYKAITGHKIAAFIPGCIAGWFSMGYFNVYRELPASFDQALRAMVKASAWPVLLLSDKTKSSERRQSSFYVSMMMLVGFGFLNAPKTDTSKLPAVFHEFEAMVCVLITIVVLWQWILMMTVRQFKVSHLYRILLVCSGLFFLQLGAQWISDGLVYLQANPQLLFAFLSACVFVWLFLKIAPNEPAESVALISTPACVPTKRDFKIAAYHEAAHALFYAALDVIPDDIKVQLKQNGTSLGYVGGIVSVDTLISKAFAEWKMFLCLSGRAAEEIVFGAATLGCQADIQQWVAVATNYIHAGFYGMGVTTALTDLFSEQMTATATIINRNRAVLDELASTLLEKRVMVKADLEQILFRVDTNGMPMYNNTGTQMERVM